MWAAGPSGYGSASGPAWRLALTAAFTKVEYHDIRIFVHLVCVMAVQTCMRLHHVAHDTQLPCI